MSAPKISVVVPAFNVARYVDECLASLQAQTITDWECIVVDDGSSDGTPERVRNFADARIGLLVQPNRGVSAARNAGLALARGEYLLFLDGDDRIHPAALERLSGALDTCRGAVAAYGTVWSLFENGSSYPQKPLHRRRFASGDLLERMIRENFLCVGTTLVRTRAALELGGFNPELRLSEDWDFWCRLAAAGDFEFVGTQPEVCYVRVHAASSSRRLSTAWENHLPTIEAVMSNPVLASRFGRRQWRRLAREVLASHLWEAGRVNFTARRYADARRLMLRSLARAPTAKRIALFGIAQLSELLGVSLVGRLRFVDEDARG